MTGSETGEPRLFFNGIFGCNAREARQCSGKRVRQKRSTLMTNVNDKAERFFALHTKGTPLVLYNIWDAGSARAVAKAGAKAIATGSWSVATANGFGDAEGMPLSLVEQIAARIVTAVDLPVTVDFEGGYASHPDQVAENAARILATGCVGINFEDQVIGGDGLYETAAQCLRIRAIRHAADRLGLKLFINARTDLFLQASDPAQHQALLPQAKDRVLAYHNAGANGFFAPGLADEGLIETLCAASPLPVNIMTGKGVPANIRLAQLGVSRISYGPHPYLAAMAHLQDSARLVFAG
jgi:2-methylisocitrate lyase-like PEP mutase family enzyme